MSAASTVVFAVPVARTVHSGGAHVSVSIILFNRDFTHAHPGLGVPNQPSQFSYDFGTLR